MTPQPIPMSYSSSPQHRRQRCRISFSCTNCRHSKQKCDRQKPCASCIRRGRRSTCHYEEAIFESNFQKSLLVRNQRPLLPAYKDNVTEEATTQKVGKEPPSIQALDILGYSNVNDHNALGIFKKLAGLDLGIDQNAEKKHSDEIRLAPGVLEKYLHLLRLLPSRPYIDILVDVFFKEFNWQYTLIDYHIFVDRLNSFYKSSYDKLAKDQSLLPESFSFPALLFQVIALGIQFLPSTYNRSLDALCVGSSFDYLGGGYSDTGIAVSGLLEKDKTNLVSIQAAFLRVCWLKNGGRVTESWHALGQVVMDAKEIGLHRVDGTVEDSELTCSQLWALEERRRVWLNLFLWDSEMAMVLGKPMNINLRDCMICPPVDARVTEDPQITPPFPRAELDRPSEFTVRLIEYRLQIYLPRVRELETEGPFPKDYTRVQWLHQEALSYIDTLPAIYRFDNPDTSFDLACPWLPAQREYLCTATWYFVLALHKPYTFTIPESRKEIMRSGITMLKAQQRYFEYLKEHHYKLFVLTYLTVEAAVSMLAVLIAYPDDNGEAGKEAFNCIRQSLARLRTIHKRKNALAGMGADVIQVLLNRVETAKIFPVSGLENTTIILNSSPESNSPAASNSIITQDSSPPVNADGGYSYSAASSFFDSGSLNAQGTTFNGADLCPVSQQDESPEESLLSEVNNSMDISGADTGYLFAPLQPTADLMYRDLAPAFNVDPISMQDPNLQILGQGFDSASVEELQQQFTGDFAENSFWSFMNQGL